MITIGSDFSGVGAFNQALIRLGIDYKEIFACDMDRYARETFIHNYGKPKYYPKNVYDREIPKESLDIYMTSPPCQAFSLAGKRKGEDDKRGILFYNSHEFIAKNKPRYFIFENVKGLLSDNQGKTFQNWLDMLGGKTVNGNPIVFPLPEATPYHIYYKVLNAKNYGVPQNRERVFIIGIRDDADNHFRWPKPFKLTKRLKDILENNVDEKYFLSDKMIKSFTNPKNDWSERFYPHNENDISKCLTARYFKNGKTDPYIKIAAMRGRNPDNPKSRKKGDNFKQTLEINENGTSNTLTSIQKDNLVVQLKQKGTLSGGKWDKINESCRRYYDENGLSPTIHTCQGGNTHPKIETNYRIRRLTVRECFRLMDFQDTFTWPVSNSQAYKQAGNSIVVNVLCEILKKLNLKNK